MIKLFYTIIIYACCTIIVHSQQPDSLSCAETKAILQHATIADGSSTSNNDKIDIPNVFTPNADGVNDCFYIAGIPPDAQLYIYDKKGRQVYEKYPYDNSWRGKDLFGKLAPDTYWYVLKIKSTGKIYRGYVFIKH